jgi:hypothetical protein
MLFNEIYSAYYNAVSHVIAAILKGGVTERDLSRIVSEHAFAESTLAVMPALRSGRWAIVGKGLSTTIRHRPTMPLTLLEKRWLRAIADDPRLRLFGVTPEGLEDVEPLFTPDDYRVFDRYSDGDPYEDEGYIERFATVLEAVKGGLALNVDFVDRNGKSVFIRCVPTKLEYSEKDDKFRVVTKGCKYVSSLNLSRIRSCRIYRGERRLSDTERPKRRETVLLRITNYRNALERVMLHFAHFEKQAESIGDGKYLLRIYYDKGDEGEMVTRILSFGPLVRVLEPDNVIELIKEKLKKQQSCEF